MKLESLKEKKMTPKFVIPVIPVCKFKEKARIEKAQTRTIILDICIDFVKLVTLGNHQATYIRITRKKAKVTQEPRSLERPYFAFEGGIIVDQKILCRFSKFFETKSVNGLIEYRMKKRPSSLIWSKGTYWNKIMPKNKGNGFTLARMGSRRFLKDSFWPIASIMRCRIENVWERKSFKLNKKKKKASHLTYSLDSVSLTWLGSIRFSKYNNKIAIKRNAKLKR